jgi:hypothetical protein
MNIFLLSRTDNLNEELRRALRGAILERGGRVVSVQRSLVTTFMYPIGNKMRGWN